MPWPKKTNQGKPLSDKLSFVDTCLYESDKTPGPGNYQISTRIGCKKSDGKLNTNKPLQPKNNLSPDMRAYNPCALQYDTFARIQIRNSKNSGGLSKSMIASEKTLKKSPYPGPGQYQVINTWLGKDSLKGDEKNYMSKISYGPTPNVYYGKSA